MRRHHQEDCCRLPPPLNIIHITLTCTVQVRIDHIDPFLFLLVFFLPVQAALIAGSRNRKCKRRQFCGFLPSCGPSIIVLSDSPSRHLYSFPPYKQRLLEEGRFIERRFLFLPARLSTEHRDRGLYISNGYLPPYTLSYSPMQTLITWYKTSLGTVWISSRLVSTHFRLSFAKEATSGSYLGFVR